MASFIAQAKGSGLDVVWAKHIIPAPPAVVGDYSPYAEQLVKANHGKAPDAVWIAGGVADTLGLSKALRNAGFKGMVVSPVYSAALLKPLADTYVASSVAPFEQNTAGGEQLVADVKAFKADASPTVTMAYGYFAADFFIKAVEKAGTKDLTRESLQNAAAHMTYQIKGLVGPTEYPKAFQAMNTYCASLLYDDGQAFKVAETYTCTDHFTKLEGNVSEVG
jgi:ABC-type branched-subunit amino acid transport system substrate-binding protein